jgi:cation-transporting ATPase E
MMPLEIMVIGLPTFFLALQSNNGKITENFLSAVIKNAIPAGAVLVINIMLLYILDYYFGEINDTVTMAIYCTTFGGFILLAVMCYKFNRYRAIMFLSMFTAAALSLVIMPGFFELQALSLAETLIVLGIMAVNIPLMLLLLKAAEKLRI